MEAQAILKQIDHPQFRVWKVANRDGTFWKNRESIRTTAQLAKLLNNNPERVYYSTSCFLSPARCKGYQSKQTTDGMLLWSDLFFDFDGDIKETQQDAIKVLDYMKSEQNYKLKKIQFSGTKGFHLVYEETKHISEPNPKARQKKYKLEKQRIQKAVEALDLNTYDSITDNIFGVYAATNSIKVKSGNMVTLLTEKQLRNPNIHKTLDKLGIHVPREPKGNDKEAALPDKLRLQTYRGGQRTRISFHSFTFVDNSIYGLKDNYVIPIEQHILKFNMFKLQLLQERYKLSDFYCFKFGDKVLCLCFKAVQAKRLEKILKAGNSDNLGLFRTRKHLPIKISNIYDEERRLAYKLEPLCVIKSEYGLNDMHSKPHCAIFKLKYPNMQGTANPIGSMRYGRSSW